MKSKLEDRQFTCILMIGYVRYFLKEVDFHLDIKKEVRNRAVWSKSNRVIVPLTEEQAGTIAREIKGTQRDVRVVRIEHILH